MKLVRPLGIELLNDEREPYLSMGLFRSVDEMAPNTHSCLKNNCYKIKTTAVLSNTDFKI